MSHLKTLTLQLDPEDYERLEAAAQRLGVQPDALARAYVRTGLGGNAAAGVDPMADAEERRRRGLAALERLAALREELRQAGYPSVDAVQLARECREELERRPYL